MKRPIRLGIAGAGAVAELCHLPALRHCPEIREVALVDTDHQRAAALASRFGISETLSDYRDLLGRVDACIVALPNHLHAPVAIDFLKAGIPVLVEKPLALSRQEAEAVTAAAAASGAPLQVGLMYRFCRAARLVKRAMEQGWLGDLQGFSLEWGSVFDWPAASGSFYRREHAGGGVLLDMGSHALDLLTWWLGPLELVGYSDDSLGGVEADCSVSLNLFHGSDERVPGWVSLSRLRELDNRVRIVGERFTIEYDLARKSSVRIRPNAGLEEECSFVFTDGREVRQAGADLYVAQLRSFARAVLTGSGSPVPGEDSVSVLHLIEQCYRERRTSRRPWLAAAAETRAMQHS